MRFRTRPKSFLDAARRDAQFEVYAWLLRQTGGHAKFIETGLVLPTEEHFPDRGLRGHAGVTALFRRVQDHAGMADWPCNLEREAADVVAVAPEGERIPVFTYRREALEPIGLIGQFAREFARYLVSSFDEPAPPSAPREALVEITAVFLGFGIFLTNAAARHGDSQLSEGELAHALALFCLLRGLPVEAADEHLNPHLRKHLRLAMLDLAQHELRFRQLRALPAAGAGTDASTPRATRVAEG